MKQLSKKWLLMFLAIVSTVCLALGLAACTPGDEDDDSGKITLSAPVIELNDNVINWEEVENATRYIVYEGDEEDGTNVTATSYTINKTEPGEYIFTVAAYNAEAEPKVGPKSNAVTYTVTAADDNDDDNNDDDGGDKTAEQLSAPVAEIEGNALNWAAVDNAASYDIYKNGTKIDAVESFTFLSDNILPTTYTITNAADGDKFQVVAVSADENTEDSDLSAEVTYTALGSTLSLTQSVYVTNETTTVNVEANGAYKVTIKPNNTEIAAGLSGVDSISVRGNPSNHDAPYGATAVLANGVYTAGIIITGDLRLFLDINALFDNVPLGFTVSLENLYSDTIVNTYTLGTTGSVDVVIPYGISGNRIQINLVDVPAFGNVLYLIADDGNVGTINFNNGSSDSGLVYHNEGYYMSSTFSVSSGSGTVYLYSLEQIDVKATITLETPDLVYANAPELTGENSIYSIDIVGTPTSAASDVPGAPTVIKVDKVPNGDYVLVLQAMVDGFVFNAKLDNGEYQTLSSAANVYSLNLTINDNKYISIYVKGERDGATAQSITLIKSGSQSYDLSASEPAEDALIFGPSAENATVFNLVNVEDGDYTLKVTCVYGVSVYAVVGATNYTLNYSSGDMIGESTAVITVSDADSIKIYTNYSLYISTVSLTPYTVAPNPKLGHGADNAATVTLTGDDNYSARVTFDLENVEAGTYTVGLVYGMYEDYYVVNVTAGSNSVQICGTSGYLGEQTIVIPEGCTTLSLTVQSGLGGSVTYTVYLLAPGETYGKGEEDDSTSLTKDITFQYTMDATIVDVSNLAAGTYNVTIMNMDYSGMETPTYQLFFDMEDIMELSGNPVATGTIEIADGATNLFVRTSNVAPITISFKLELVGGGTGGEGGQGGEGGGTATYLNKTVTVGSYFEYAGGPGTLDVSSLAYGEYKIYFVITGLTFESNPVVYFTCNSELNDSTDTALTPQTWGTVTINSDTLYVHSFSISGTEISVELEKAESSAGGGSENSLTHTATVGSYFAYAGGPLTLDVSTLAYGEYKIYFEVTGFTLESSPVVYFTCNSELNDSTDTSLTPQTWGTVTINSDTLYIYSFSISGVEISVQLEKV